LTKPAYVVNFVFIENSQMVAFSDAGIIYNSNDGGNSWSNIASVKKNLKRVFILVL